MRSDFLNLADGRKLGLASLGDPTGVPCFYFHGWPGSRLEAALFHEGACQNGVFLISLERPGIGLSDFLVRRSLKSWPRDVEAAAALLGLQRFAVLGYSAGAPYALACAALLREHVLSTTLVAGLGAIDQPALLELLPTPARSAFILCRRAQWLAVPLCGLFFRWVRPSPQRLLPRIYLKSLCPSDQAVLANAHTRQVVHDSVVEAFRAGPRGVAWDGKVLPRPWGISLQAIQSPVFLWHGEADHEVPVAMRQDLAGRLPGVQTRFLKDEGHFSLPWRHQASILAEIRRGFDLVPRTPPPT